MTKPVRISISHELGVEEAKRRIAGGFGRLIQQMPGGAMMTLSESWTGDRMNFSAKALGQNVTGHVDVAANHVTLEVVLPPFLAALADGLRGRLQKAGQLLLRKG